MEKTTVVNGKFLYTNLVKSVKLRKVKTIRTISGDQPERE